jgi:hypothetical protein
LKDKIKKKNLQKYQGQKLQMKRRRIDSQIHTTKRAFGNVAAGEVHPQPHQKPFG